MSEEKQSLIRVETLYGDLFTLENDFITKHLVKYKAHTRNELAMIKSIIEAGDNIIDIGAHIGSFSIPFAHFNNREGKVFSFEGSLSNYNILRKNIEINGLNDVIISENAVIHNEDIDVQLEGAKRGNRSNTGSCFFQENSEGGSKSVSIDKWLKNNCNDIKINFLKVDVEGAEENVLLSCIETLKRDKPCIYVEVCNKNLSRFGSSAARINDLLKSLGYLFFQNSGKRNSKNDKFKIVEVKEIDRIKGLYDILAIHKDDSKLSKINI
jgi:FkbM family methyltransferase